MRESRYKVFISIVFMFLLLRQFLAEFFRIDNADYNLIAVIVAMQSVLINSIVSFKLM